MGIYKYTASIAERENFTEEGTVLADSEDEARRKLKQYRFDNIHIKKLTGLSAIVKRFSVDIK